MGDQELVSTTAIKHMATYDISPQAHRVDASRATAWLSEGWRLFNTAPGVWIAITIVLIVIQLLFGMLPLVGQIASALLTPVLAGGLMECARIANQGDPLQFDQMFAGFRRNTGNLVMVGLLTLIGFTLISIISFAVLGVIGGMTLLNAIQSGTFNGIDFVAAAGGIMTAVLIWLLLALPLSMAIWFAPALVMYDNLAPVNAMKSSFHACMHNWLSLSIYGLVLCVLAFIAAIPLGLGFLVLIPVAAASIFISYRDIYH